MEEKIFFKSKDGTLLCGIWSIPELKNGKALILAHGITVDKDEDGLFPPLAKKLSELGFSVFRFDFRGHGESGGDSVDMTISGELADLEAAYLLVKEKGFHKIGLLGASFGGGIASIFSAKSNFNLDFLCLWYPVLNYDHTFVNPYLPWLKNKIGPMKKDFQTKGWTYLINGKTFKIGRHLYDEMKIYYPYKELSKVKTPTVIVHGDSDTYVPYSDSKVYIGKIKNKHELITIEEADHGFGGKKEEYFEKEAVEKTVDSFRNYL